VKVKGIRWVGVGTDRVSEMRAFASDVLGLRVVGEDREDFVELAMEDGAKLELFASTAAAEEPWMSRSTPLSRDSWSTTSRRRATSSRGRPA
jgi:hypothetical protein